MTTNQLFIVRIKYLSNYLFKHLFKGVTGSLLSLQIQNKLLIKLN